MYLKTTLGTLILSLAITIAPITQAATDAIDVKTVVSEGLGSDVASAAQNAAQSALIDVVGSFMDSTKILEKRVEIQDGVRSQTSKINTNVKEYSQGSIQSFEILKVSQQDGLTKVTAKVAVRMEDFRAYIEKLAHGETSFDGAALSAQAKQLGVEINAKESSALKQKENKTALLYDNVLMPIFTGQIIEFKVGTPVLAAKADLSKSERLKSEFNSMAKKFGAETVFLIRVTALLNQDYILNTKKTLQSISKQFNNNISEYEDSSSHYFRSSVWSGTSIDKPLYNQFVVTIIDGDLGVLSEVKNEKSEKTLPVTAYMIDDVDGFPTRGMRINEKLRPFVDNNYETNLKPTVSIIDAYNNALINYTATDRYTSNAFAINESYFFAGGLIHPWSLFKTSLNEISMITKREFYLLISLQPDVLASAKKIQITLTK